MSPSGSPIEEDVGVAERLAEGQRAISIAEFFEKNKHMLGFDSGARALVTAVKEGVDNALDACEEAKIHPDLYVEIKEDGDYYTLIIEDNGPGITKEQVPKIFGKLLYGSRFHRREQSLTPDQRILVRFNDEIKFIPIGMLVDAFLPKASKGVAIAAEMQALAFNRDTLETSWQPIEAVFRHETDGPVYRINTELGRSVTVTGHHGLFSLSHTGQPMEVEAADLSEGEYLLAPRNIPQVVEPVTSVNLLEHIDLDAVDDRRIHVYGFDEDTLAEIRTGELVRKRINDGSRRRYFYRYRGVDILRDSFEQKYIEHGFLPIQLVKRLGWEERAADCELRTYQVGGKQTATPVTLEIDDSFVRLLAHYISEGHVGDRQVGFTFGSHETALIGQTEAAVAAIGGQTTTVDRERNSTSVKAVGSPLALFLRSVCGASPRTKRIPSFIYHIPPALQRTFIAALIETDGSAAHPGNEIEHLTTSPQLARQLNVLLSMHGIVASSYERHSTEGYAEEGTTCYLTKLFGKDSALLGHFEDNGSDTEPRYARIPTAVLDPVRVDGCRNHTVPDTIPGLLYGAGIGSSPEFAEAYQRIIEEAIDGERRWHPRYTQNLQALGLLDEQYAPTKRLLELWESVNALHGFTKSDLCLLRIESIEVDEPPEYVFDIGVPGETRRDENFVVINEGAICVKNSRGQQGIGISAAVLYAQLTSGKPARITSKPKGSDVAQYFEVIVDTEANEPDIRAEQEIEWDRKHGTRIELDLEANMRARTQLHDYIEQTAIVNPHARIELHEPGLDEPRRSERVTNQLPAETEIIKPHPHGVELGTLIKMLEATDSYSLSGFLREEFTRVGRKTADGVIAAFRDHHYGRELTWTPPGAHEDLDLGHALMAAVTNKGKTATAMFADEVVATVAEHERVSHQDLETIIDEAADHVEAETDRRFGSTVRENAVEAAWTVLLGESAEVDRLESDLYVLIDEATGKHKDDRTKQALAERLIDRIRAADRPTHRFTRADLEDLIDAAADATERYADVTFGDTARENVLDILWTSMRPVEDDPPSVRDVAASRDLAAAFLAGMREVDIMAPPTDCLAPITAELIEEGLEKEYDAEFYAAATRDAAVYGGDPFIVEAGVAYGGELESESKVNLQRFANRVPLVYQQGACAITDVVRSIDWRNYNLDQPGGSGLPSGPMVLVVHVASTNVPFTSESKDAVANIPEIEHEVELAVREVARGVKRHISQRRSLQQRREKEDVIARVLPEIANKVSAVVQRDRPDIEATLARIMNNVHVARRIEANGDVNRVTLEIKNYDSSIADLEVTDILDVEPADVTDDATVVEMDGEWYVRWKPRIDAGDTASISYELPDGAEANLAVSGLPPEKLTIDQ